MNLAEKMRARRQSWRPDSRFRSDPNSPILRFIPPPQRDPVELAAWFGCPVSDIAAVRPKDVSADGIRLHRRLVAWPAAIPVELRERVLCLARATPTSMRLFETQKPRIRAAYDLRSAMVQAIESANAAKKMRSARVAGAPPDFVVLGVPRSATTWLYTALSTHPDVYLPKSKEQEFFGDYRFHLGWNWYLNNFAARANQAVAGDVSVGYFHSLEAPGQIAELLGADRVKLIVVLREPVDRARSYYNYRMIRGMMPATFEQAISIPYFHDLFVAQGHYARYLERWHAAFDPSRLLILLYEDIRLDPGAALAKIAGFLEVSPQPFVVPARENNWVKIAPVGLHRFLLRSAADLDVALPSRTAAVGRLVARQLRAIDSRLCVHGDKPYVVSLSPETERLLREEFEPSNERLARMTGLDLSRWRYSAVERSRGPVVGSNAAAQNGTPHAARTA